MALRPLGSFDGVSGLTKNGQTPQAEPLSQRESTITDAQREMLRRVQRDDGPRIISDDPARHDLDDIREVLARVQKGPLQAYFEDPFPAADDTLANADVDLTEDYSGDNELPEPTGAYVLDALCVEAARTMLTIDPPMPALAVIALEGDVGALVYALIEQVQLLSGGA